MQWDSPRARYQFPRERSSALAVLRRVGKKYAIFRKRPGTIVLADISLWAGPVVLEPRLGQKCLQAGGPIAGASGNVGPRGPCSPVASELRRHSRYVVGAKIKSFAGHMWHCTVQGAL